MCQPIGDRLVLFGCVSRSAIADRRSASAVRMCQPIGDRLVWFGCVSRSAIG
ncbi:hypothetical protein L3Y34_012943 [Caenorhabditis briggsae]|uniref:Uncharacterized protein n=1 Tax=Caenorhabditis briggsae TaxID=6238 RepID=A0AAE8ZSL1_CAEBR|nr:hypothetical protein L3Y34_012943 [Caenorhabditis briggsae]